MDNLKIFVIHNDKNKLSLIRENECIKKYNLDDLDVGKYQKNSFAENRFLYFLSNNLKLINQEYVGIASASWDEKYKKLNKTKIEDLINLNLNKNTIYCAHKTLQNWIWYSEQVHRGMCHLIDELLDRNNFEKNNPKSSFWANNFICHKDIMIEFLNWWKPQFEYFSEKKFNFNCPDTRLIPAYFLERLTTAYFSNKNYEITQVSPDFIKNKNLSTIY